MYSQIAARTVGSPTRLLLVGLLVPVSGRRLSPRAPQTHRVPMFRPKICCRGLLEEHQIDVCPNKKEMWPQSTRSKPKLLLGGEALECANRRCLQQGLFLQGERKVWPARFSSRRGL